MKNPQLALGILSALFIAIGLSQLLGAGDMWPLCHRFADYPLKPMEAILLCGFGTAGIAFLAWLKR